MQKLYTATPLLCCFIFALSIFASEPSGKTQSNSFMWIRPAFMSLSSDQSGWHSIVYNPKKTGSKSFQIKGISQISFSNNAAKQYFLFGYKNKLLVAGDATPLSNIRDIRAEWLGIENNQFIGTLTVDPYQRQAGATFTYFQDLSAVSFLPKFWLSLEIPFFSVKHNLNLQQLNTTNNTQTTQKPYDILSAFRQINWLYSKIDGPTYASNIMGAIFKFGKTFLSESQFQVIGYSLLNFALGNNQNAQYLFDAYTGTNRHVGIGAGALFQILLNKSAQNIAICWYFGLENQYFFPNVQNRTFDLKNKPWSRYMLYNHIHKGPNQSIPGVNILTHKTLVRPYSFIDFQTGWRFITENCEFECGYELWGRGDERVRIYDEVQEVFGIAGINGGSASESTIAYQAPNDSKFTPFKKSDIDPYSAAASSALNHKATCFFTYLTSYYHSDIFFILGGAIEYAQKNAALPAWTIWLKAGWAQ